MRTENSESDKQSGTSNCDIPKMGSKKLDKSHDGNDNGGYTTCIYDHMSPSGNMSNTCNHQSRPSVKSRLLPRVIPGLDMYVALDCEFVGVGPKKINALARCSIVDHSGDIVLDIYVQPNEPIIDFRTRWSGIRPRHMKHAIPFNNARRMAIRAVQGKIVVGHAVTNDFKALRYFHPTEYVRDTSLYKPLRQMGPFDANSPVSLKRLTLQLRGYHIQKKEHCSVEDSRATMELFKLVHIQWETSLLSQAQSKPGCSSDFDMQKSRHTRTVSESSDESYLKDHFWPEEIHV